jgi:subtilisin family serine protease
LCAGIATVSRHLISRSESRDVVSPVAGARETAASDSSTSLTSSKSPSASAQTKAAIAPAGGGQAGAAAQQANPLPPVTTPYEQEPEIDLSTHYAIIKGQRAHPYKLLAKYKTTAAASARSEALGELELRAQSQFPLTPDLVVIKPVIPVAVLVTSAQEAEAIGGELSKRAEVLRQTGQFEYIEPDYIMAIDATPSDQAFADGTLWGLRNTGLSGGLSGADIDAVNAWNTTTGSTSVVVAVIDTGVRYTHQDLSAQMWRNPDEVAGNGIDDDQDGYVTDMWIIYMASMVSPIREIRWMIITMARTARERSARRRMAVARLLAWRGR